MSLRQVDNVAIIGVGLIGGSFGMALRKRGLAGSVIGIGRSPQRLERALQLGAVDHWSTDVEAGVRGADLVYVSTPVGLEADFIRRVVPAAKAGCVITDAGSTKDEICRAADALVGDQVSFVGGHPMAGSEAVGVEAADPDLFVGAAYALTPTERTDPEAVDMVRALAEAIGSRVVIMDPGEHDRCVAVISHLPHLIAAALVSLAESRSVQRPEVLELVAGGFRDLTRIASSSPALWRDICLTNAGAIREAAEGFRRFLDEGLEAAESRDAAALEAWFDRAKRIRDSVFPKDAAE